MTDLPQEVDSRNTDIFFKRAFLEIDSTTFFMPEELTIDKVPLGESFESPFGSYSMNIISKKNQLLYIRKLTVNEGQFPKSQYPDLLDFFNKVSKADEKMFLLTKHK
jgi:hypothetical protein